MPAHRAVPSAYGCALSERKAAFPAKFHCDRPPRNEVLRRPCVFGSSPLISAFRICCPSYPGKPGATFYLRKAPSALSHRHDDADEIIKRLKNARAHLVLQLEEYLVLRERAQRIDDECRVKRDLQIRAAVANGH